MGTRIPILLLVVYTALLGASHAEPRHAGRRRAVLIGINDYTASRLGVQKRTPPPERDWPNLLGTVNDVFTIEETLTSLYGFDRADILKLTDQNATRNAILKAIETHLVAPAASGDVLFFYYAGHGSQVRNTLSDEPDKLDESIVPADSRLGAADIRDKELRSLFNRILDRGARLTIVLDNCHSGSGARGLMSGARPRGIAADWSDVKDASNGPRPEERGALVLSATEDFDKAWETRDENGNMHGAFSWAWIRAMRDAAQGEPAIETFLRAQARMRAETPFQEPVLAGNQQARLNPFLGVRNDRRGERAVVAVEKIREDGSIVLRGGWLNGVTIGSELRLLDDPRSPLRLKVTALNGSTQSEARVHSGGTRSQLPSGTLLEIVSWAAPPGRPLRVWTPRADVPIELVRKFALQAEKRGVRWITRPIDHSPTHVLRRNIGGWELLGAYGAMRPIGSDDAALNAIAKLPRDAKLFVQLPAPRDWKNDIDGVDEITNAADADYILAGRYVNQRIEYAWVRPAVSRQDQRKSGIPLRSDWMKAGQLRDSVVRLRRIFAWHMLESRDASPYRLTVEGAKNGQVIGGRTYKLVLTSTAQKIAPRYYYVFVLDSFGKSVLASPRLGSVENRFPVASTAPSRIELPDTIDINAPYGIDTYFLLATDDPLPNPWILEWDGVRSRTPKDPSPLEELLQAVDSGARANYLFTPRSWSIERVTFEAVPPS